MADAEWIALAERVRTLEEFAREQQSDRRRLARALRRTRFLAVGMAAVLAVSVPLAAIAVTQSFADVPTTSPFYTVIERVKAAGITAGCGGGNFCPKDAVTREQMSAFLNRAAGRISPQTFQFALAANGTAQEALIPLRAGDVSGALAYMRIDVNASVSIGNRTDCPCVVELTVVDGTGTVIGPATRYAQIDALSLSNVDTLTISSLYVGVVNTGVDRTAKARFRVIAGPAQMTVTGIAAGTYYPFAWDGSALLPD